VVLSAVLMIVILATVAFAVDVGYIAMVRTQLQAAADAAALAAAGSANLPQSQIVQVAQAFAQYHQVGGRAVQLNAGDVQFGLWDVNSKTFTAVSGGQMGTAVKVTARVDDSSGGEAALHFARVLGMDSVAVRASAVAVVNPRDIAFVVDTSGSMNDDTTPDSASANTSFIQQVYTDFGFGTYPGAQQTLGTGTTVQLMNTKLKTVMPNAVPTPDTSSPDSVRYWGKYFAYIGSNGVIGYKTYVKFMMKKGRAKPVVDGTTYTPNVATQYSPLSVKNPAYRSHLEMTDGGLFSLPTPEMPFHAVRRALIAALKVIQDRNGTISDPSQRDRVSLIVFDYKNTSTDTTHVRVAKALTDDYADVMDACRTLQAADDDANCTDTEGGLICARDHIRPTSQGGMGREGVNKVIVLLTDGIPNLYQSPNATIDDVVAANPGGWGSSYAQNAALMQGLSMQGDNWYTYPVGVGLAGDQTFLNRMAVKSGTAKNGAGYSVANDSSTYETTLRTIFESIITNPKLRLVQ
jgi:hypothetical protein